MKPTNAGGGDEEMSVADDEPQFELVEDDAATADENEDEDAEDENAEDEEE